MALHSNPLEALGVALGLGDPVGETVGSTEGNGVDVAGVAEWRGGVDVGLALPLGAVIGAKDVETDVDLVGAAVGAVFDVHARTLMAKTVASTLRDALVPVRVRAQRRIIAMMMRLMSTRDECRSSGVAPRTQIVVKAARSVKAGSK